MRGWWVLLVLVALVAAAGVRKFMSVDLVKRLEGLRLDVYQDEAGKWTIGYGHLVKPGDPFHPYGPVRSITHAEAEALLVDDMDEARRAVAQLVVVPLTASQREALESFVFNVGRGAFAQSTLLARLNSGDYAAAAEQFDRWVWVTDPSGVKRKSDILKARRSDERELFEAVA
jgi:lysozyme